MGLYFSESLYSRVSEKEQGIHRVFNDEIYGNGTGASDYCAAGAYVWALLDGAIS
jgi:hypothetical protein